MNVKTGRMNTLTNQILFTDMLLPLFKHIERLLISTNIEDFNKNTNEYIQISENEKPDIFKFIHPFVLVHQKQVPSFLQQKESTIIDGRTVLVEDLTVGQRNAFNKKKSSRNDELKLEKENSEFNVEFEIKEKEDKKVQHRETAAKVPSAKRKSLNSKNQKSGKAFNNKDAFNNYCSNKSSNTSNPDISRYYQTKDFLLKNDKGKKLHGLGGNALKTETMKVLRKQYDSLTDLEKQVRF